MQQSRIAGAAMAETYTIGHLAEEFGVTRRTIRFYEDKELIRPMRNGQARIFSRRDRARLKLILRGKRLGFSLAEIKEMLDLYDLGDGQIEQLKLTLKKGLDRVANLERQQGDIDSALTDLRDGCQQIARLLGEKGIDVDEI